LINAGITTVVYAEGYADDLAREMMGETGIIVHHFIPDTVGQTP
jgi:dCMP deaminase